MNVVQHVGKAEVAVNSVFDVHRLALSASLGESSNHRIDLRPGVPPRYFRYASRDSTNQVVHPLKDFVPSDSQIGIKGIIVWHFSIASEDGLERYQFLCVSHWRLPSSLGEGLCPSPAG
ncbi:MAG: hypothetical protein J6R54_02100 [Bacteroidaceae bacterium]|nr:hypothetical protein [Bacteroidaceae bacterium]